MAARWEGGPHVRLELDGLGTQPILSIDMHPLSFFLN